jgi:hypothetical protein
MSTLINGDTLNATITLTKQNNTVITLDTDQKYVAKDIELVVNAQSASPSFDGGALNSKGASATFTNATTSSSNTSGISILAQGTAGRDSVLYNGAVNGWVNAADNATASAAVASSTWNGTTYYLTGVNLTNGNSFNITVPDGNSTTTYNISVDNQGNVTGLGGGYVLIEDTADSHGGTIRTLTAIQVAGSQTITQNGTYDISTKASVIVDVAGGSTEYTDGDYLGYGGYIGSTIGTAKIGISKIGGTSS